MDVLYRASIAIKRTYRSGVQAFRLAGVRYSFDSPPCGISPDKAVRLYRIRYKAVYTALQKPGEGCGVSKLKYVGLSVPFFAPPPSLILPFFYEKGFRAENLEYENYRLFFIIASKIQRLSRRSSVPLALGGVGGEALA